MAPEGGVSREHTFHNVPTCSDVDHISMINGRRHLRFVFGLERREYAHSGAMNVTGQETYSYSFGFCKLLELFNKPISFFLRSADQDEIIHECEKIRHTLCERLVQ